MTVTRSLQPTISVRVPRGEYDRTMTVMRVTQEQAVAKCISNRSLLLVYEDQHPRPSMMIDCFTFPNEAELNAHLTSFIMGRCTTVAQDMELSEKMLKALREAILAHKDFLLSSNTNPERT